MDIQEYCDYLQSHYERRHPHLYDWRCDHFAPAFLDALDDGTPQVLRAACTEVHPSVYTFPLLQPRFCRELLEELEHFESWMANNELAVIRPNTMNNYGAVLDTFGFAPFLQRLLLECVVPFAALFYPEVGGATLDEHHGFIVEYSLDKDKHLDFHVDASDVTLNVCLGQEFTGGELFFRGVRCGLCQQTEPLPHEIFDIAHHPGQAILHRGNHRHGANPIRSGARANLILWCYSSQFGHQQQREHRSVWCGWPTPGRY